MSALQFAGLVPVACLAAAAGGRLVDAREWDRRRTYRAYAVGGTALVALLAISYLATGTAAAVRAPLPGGATGLLAGWVPFLPAAWVVAVAGAYGAGSAAGSRRSAAVAAGTYLGVVFAVGAVALVAVGLVLDHTGTVGRAALVALVLAVVPAVDDLTDALAFRLSPATRPPTDEERTRIEALAPVDLPALVYEGEAAESVAGPMGVPGWRSLVAGDAFVERSDETAEAVRAYVAAGFRTGYHDRRLALRTGRALAVGLGGVLAVAAWGRFGPAGVAVAAGATLAALVAIDRRAVADTYRIDRAVAREVGREATEAAIDEARSVRGRTLESGRLARIYRMQPSPAARFDRLLEAEASETDRGPGASDA